MKHKLLLLFIVLFQASITNAQEKSDLQKEELFGKVKTQTLEKLTSVIKPDGSTEEKRILLSIHSYDRNENCTDAIAYNFNNPVPSKFGNKIFHDSKGREVERHFTNAEGALTAKSFSFYNKKGQKLKQMSMLL
jgi:hypothetical protein